MPDHQTPKDNTSSFDHHDHHHHDNEPSTDGKTTTTAPLAPPSYIESLVGRLTTPALYLFAIVVLLSQLHATIMLLVLLATAFCIYQYIVMKQEKQIRDWEVKHPVEAKQNSFEEKVRHAMLQLQQQQLQGNQF